VNDKGIVGVEWAEFNGRCWRFSVSYDGGEHFGPSLPINGCARSMLPYAVHLRDYLGTRGYSPPSANGVIEISLEDWRTYEKLGRGTALTATGSSFFAVWAAFGGGEGDDAFYTTRIDIKEDH